MDEIPPPADKPNRPKATLFNQQALPAVRLFFTPWIIIISYAVVGLLFIPMGVVMTYESDKVVEYQYTYDGSEATDDSCKIVMGEEGKSCQISFSVTEAMSAPVYVFYELASFYQNHGQYVDSYDSNQLEGSTSTSDIDSCSPLEYNGSLVLHPCGLVANTLFNDNFSLNDTAYSMSETDISWPNDVGTKYVQPDGFTYVECDTSTYACDDTECLGSTYTGCKTYTDDSGTTYAYYYPNDDTTQYAYESFSNVIDPITGIENDHFAVWMRSAGLANFRKPYGRILTDIPAGTTLTFDVSNYFLVNLFDGQKKLIISTSNGVGMRNAYWPASFFASAAVILATALVMLLKQLIRPRVMGDTKHLVEG